MISPTVISILSNDSTLTSLLEGNNVFPTNAYDETVNKQINVSVEYGKGESWDKDTFSGIIKVYILIKDTISSPMSLLEQIATRVVTLLNLEGSDLDDTRNRVYRIKKTADSFIHYKKICFYEMLLEFEYNVKHK